MDTGICTTCGAADVPIDENTEQCEDCGKDETQESSKESSGSEE